MFQYVKIIKEVGYPIFTSLILFGLLAWLLKFILRYFLNSASLQEKNADTLDNINSITIKIWEKFLRNSGGGA